MGTRRESRAVSLLLAGSLFGLLGCETMLDDHKKVDVDFCGDYKGGDDCCAEDDPCDDGDDAICQCYGCGWDLDDCTMVWRFGDLCDDGYTVDIGIYQVGADGFFDEAAGELQWEGLVLEEFSEQVEFEVNCTPGEYMCYGGWSDSGMWWGCAENCQQYCPDCCVYCDLSGEATFNLICD
jgi:hypothetical protein